MTHEIFLADFYRVSLLEYAHYSSVQLARLYRRPGVMELAPAGVEFL